MKKELEEQEHESSLVRNGSEVGRGGGLAEGMGVRAPAGRGQGQVDENKGFLLQSQAAESLLGMERPSGSSTSFYTWPEALGSS